MGAASFGLPELASIELAGLLRAVVVVAAGGQLGNLSAWAFCKSRRNLDMGANSATYSGDTDGTSSAGGDGGDG